MNHIDKLRLEIIKRHSMLEGLACEVFRIISGCRDNVASQIFYSMDYKRYEVMKSIIKEDYQNFFPTYKKIHKEIITLNEERNKIVHWETWSNQEKGFELADPKYSRNLTYFFDNKKRYSKKKLEEILDNFKEVQEVLISFWNCFELNTEDEIDQNLLQIFQTEYSSFVELVDTLKKHYKDLTK